MWQHGQCASQANQPGVYICAFCANMPSARGQSVGLGLGMASSPLANKSFRGLR